MNLESLSGVQLAKLFGVDPAIITRYKASGMPHKNGRYNLTICHQWTLEDARKKSGSDSSSGGPAPDEGLRRLRIEKARIARLERKQKEGSLVPRDQALAWCCSLAAEAKTALLAIPRRLAPIVVGMTPRLAEAAMSEAIRDGLWKLAPKDESRPEDGRKGRSASKKPIRKKP